MIKNPNRMRLGGLLWLCFFVAGIAQASDLKVGVVNPGEILERAPQALVADAQLKKEFEAREKEIREMIKHQKALEKRLERDGDVIGDDERSRLERDIVATNRDVKRAQDDVRDDFNLRRNQELVRLQKVVQEAIADLAKEEKFDLIVSDGVVFASERIDITNLVLKRLAVKAKKAAAAK